MIATCIATQNTEKFIAVLQISALLLFASCSKSNDLETVDNGSPIGNEALPPIANAGPDQEIVYPSVNVQLDGSDSNDPDGTISTWSWNEIAGLYSYIRTPDQAKTSAESLTAGTYLFELTVTDMAGLTAKDTVQITVQGPDFCGDYNNRTPISAKLVQEGTLSKTYGIAVATAKDKIFFAGGWSSSGPISSLVNIYNITSKTWSAAELSEPREYITAVANGNKVFFAGGIIAYDDFGGGSILSDAVDIYDVEMDIWTQAHLSIEGVGMAATVVDDKILFAGGSDSSNRGTRVDIYDQSSGEWTTASLSENKPWGQAAVTLGNRAYFAGSGFSDKVDIYDAVTGNWSVETMYEGKASGLAGITLIDKIYWAGGWTPNPNNHAYQYPSSVIEIWDTSSGNSTLACLKYATGNCMAVQQGDRIVFLSPTIWTGEMTYLDIYDPVADHWYYSSIPFYIENAISVNGNIYVTVPENGKTTVSILEFF